MCVIETVITSESESRGAAVAPIEIYIVYGLRPRAWFVTKEQNQALVEPLGPNTTNFQSSSPRFTLLTNQALV